MYITIGTLLFIFIGVELIRYLSNRNWKLIYSTYGYDDYFKVITKLKAEGIKYKIDHSSIIGDSRVNRYKDNTRYDILVKKEAEHKAIKALQKI